MVERQTFKPCAIRKRTQGNVAEVVYADLLHRGCANASHECGMKGYREHVPVDESDFASESETFQLQSQQNGDHFFHNPSIQVELRMVNTAAAEIVYDSRIVRKQRGKLIWLESEMVLVVSLDIIIVDDNMGVEDWFDESGKNKMSLATSDEA